MGKISLKKGQLLHRMDNTVHTIEIILSGSITVFDAYCSITVPAGGIIGFLETPETPYSYTYEAASDCTVFEYPYTAKGDLEKIISSNPKIVPNMVSASLRTYMEAYQAYMNSRKDADGMYNYFRELYDTYLELCEAMKGQPEDMPALNETGMYVPENDVPAWELQYFNSMRNLPLEVRTPLFTSSVYTGLGLIMISTMATAHMMMRISYCVDYMTRLGTCAVSDEPGDFFDLYSGLLFITSKNPYADTSQLEETISRLIVYLSNNKYVDIGILHARVKYYRNTLKDIENSHAESAGLGLGRDAHEALNRSLDTILVYSDISQEAMDEFRELMDQYRLLSDKNSTDDTARKLRSKISKHFYHIYYSAFMKSLSDRMPPAAVRMFFAFGYMDEELCGMENAAILFDFINSRKPDPSGLVLTMYEWLVKIYKGEAEPSRNEFNLDYAAFLRDQKNNGYISESEEKKRLRDKSGKVRFEIENFFTLGNRVTFGRVTTFCPVLSEHNILRPLKSIYLDHTRIHDAFDNIRSVDYSCFYRPVIYSDTKIGITKEYISTEVLPNVILMPNIGSRGCLWQETTGVKRDTPGRVMMSILPIENVSDMMLKIAAEFRWELCKHIQGMRWNDVTDPSLTADYCDYIQFYRKNRDLSNDAKEKLKLQLTRAKNNYRDAFVIDYMQWVKYESTGSPRLNKVAREILFKYVPFPAETLSGLCTNPMYKDLIEKRGIKQSQRLHTLNILCQKLTNQGTDIPDEIIQEIEFQKR